MQTQNQYIPGACNIGESEVRKRKLTGWTGLLITIILYLLLIYLDAPKIWRLAIFIPTMIAAIGFLQAYMHFCAYFGLRGVFNFGPIGNTYTVEQREFRAKDRKKALQIIIFSIIIGIMVAVLAYYIPNFERSRRL